MQKLILSIFKKLKSPLQTSHKGQNGILYIVAGSKQYHGSLWYAIEIASRLVDLIYVETDLSNYALVRALKKLHPAIILVSPAERKTYLAKSDCVLLGPGLGRSERTKKLVCNILASRYCPVKRVIDADALYYLTKSLYTEQTVITPHAGEYQALFGEQNPVLISQMLPSVIVAKGHKTVICQNGKSCYNSIGNAGLTKGGTGDVLAGLIAALGCTHSVWLASRLAVVAEGCAAETLAKRYATRFSTTQLIEQIPKTFHHYSQ
ncbi:MAG: NAD(P)H-hydrate dehydratase [Patescibacteria group bacterium]|jgi:NAD(P)H-hydrate epimerase